MPATREKFNAAVEQAQSCSALYRHRKAKHKLILAAPMGSFREDPEWMTLYEGSIDFMPNNIFKELYELVSTRPLFEHGTIDTQAR